MEAAFIGLTALGVGRALLTIGVRTHNTDPPTKKTIIIRRIDGDTGAFDTIGKLVVISVLVTLGFRRILRIGVSLTFRYGADTLFWRKENHHLPKGRSTALKGFEDETPGEGEIILRNYPSPIDGALPGA
jgi:hypothetical protein